LAAHGLHGFFAAQGLQRFLTAQGFAAFAPQGPHGFFGAHGLAAAACRRGTTQLLLLADAAPAHGLHGLHGLAAAHGLHGFFAAHGLQGFFAAQGLHAFFAAQGLHGFLAAHGLAARAIPAGFSVTVATPATPNAIAIGMTVVVSMFFRDFMDSLHWRSMRTIRPSWSRRSAVSPAKSVFPGLPGVGSRLLKCTRR
jgi:hypothetical protein